VLLLSDVYFQDRDQYCDKVSSPPSDALKSLFDDTKSYPFKQVFAEGKTLWDLNPIMVSGHLEGNVN